MFIFNNSINFKMYFTPIFEKPLKTKPTKTDYSLFT